MRLNFIEDCHLIDIARKAVIWADEEIIAHRSYLVFFSRSGFKISRESLANALPHEVVMLGKPLFFRDGREYRVKVIGNLIQIAKQFSEGLVQELYINKSRKYEIPFVCPFLHCGKIFRKSCDLNLHFNVEVRAHF